jgi:hypothetical protein
MNKFRLTINILAIAIFMFAFASFAQAQATRTWVSGVGDDVNPCSRTAPCKTFAGAISKTASLGEISVLDPGGFGAVTITKSITIDGGKGAGFGSILASGTSGVIINAAGINVILRNLSINGASTTAGSGIRFLNGRSLTVEDCQIFGFTGTGVTNVGDGISVELAVANSNVVVRNTSITNCTKGIRLTTSSGFVTAEINDVHILQPTATVSSAIEVATGGIANIRDSEIANYQTGINVTGAAASSASAHVVRTHIFNTTTGLAVGNTTSGVSASSFVLNTTAISLAGGIIRTGCDNFFDGNSSDVAGGALTNACVK